MVLHHSSLPPPFLPGSSTTGVGQPDLSPEVLSHLTAGWGRLLGGPSESSTAPEHTTATLLNVEIGFTFVTPYALLFRFVFNVRQLLADVLPPCATAADRHDLGYVENTLMNLWVPPNPRSGLYTSGCGLFLYDVSLCSCLDRFTISPEYACVGSPTGQTTEHEGFSGTFP
ncbi:hypothetical protein Sjap_002586 [Stephania japonica]|uniref:Uncharacterized protein n=1 Tax=Stephania japonica TaxID=461633 RepID=A0AAP0KM49_9MAGN